MAEGKSDLNIVAVGGGTGLATLLSGLKQFVTGSSERPEIADLSAIVAVSDDGGTVSYTHLTLPTNREV